MIKAYWWPAKNFGDTLTPFIVEHVLGKAPIAAERHDEGKLLAVGSIMAALNDYDVVWGTGWNRTKQIRVPSHVKFLAVRGPLTKSYLLGAEVPQVYGDPAILLPLLYNPKIKKTHKVGVLPHYVDKPFVQLLNGEKLIDIQADWKTVVEEVLSCEKIKASSLHGIICAEAYGIPAIWVKYSDKIIGGELKFQDYFLGTGRKRQRYFTEIPPIENLKERQDILIKVLKDFYAKK